MDMVRGARCVGVTRGRSAGKSSVFVLERPLRALPRKPQHPTEAQPQSTLLSTVFHSRHLGSYYCDTL